MSGEDAPRPYQENLIVLEIKTNKQTYVFYDVGVRLKAVLATREVDSSAPAWVSRSEKDTGWAPAAEGGQCFRNAPP